MTAPFNLTDQEFHNLATLFAEQVFAGKHPAVAQARAQGFDRGVVVVQVSEGERLPDGSTALHVHPGFQPAGLVAPLLTKHISAIATLETMLQAYDPQTEVVVLILTPVEARSYRLRRKDLVRSARPPRNR